MSEPIPIRTHPPDHDRLPVGQHLTTKWPVLTYGPTPMVDTATWRCRVFGEVERTVELSWDDLHRLPFVRVRADMHCVTTWSIYDMAWGGFRVRDVLALAGPKPEATHVMQHAYGGYTTNTDLSALMDDDALIATEANGEPLDAEHGGPARVVVPKRWAWKGAKWVNGFQLMTGDRRGFWEVNGYHNQGDPWGDGEERYSSQEKAVQTRKEGNQLRRKP
ncbi:MAG: sulfite oxidase-like oxidoreductase [Planctomycetes bacterium]|nr:sulfite oxidase-like oxidoreductase [Planctomycetota bacterium]